MNTNKLNKLYSTHEIKMCRGKQRHFSREGAVLEHIRKHQKGICDWFLRAYQCSFCGHWHNTKDDPRNLLTFKKQQEIRIKFGLADLEELRIEVERIEKKAKKAIKNKNNS